MATYESQILRAVENAGADRLEMGCHDLGGRRELGRGRAFQCGGSHGDGDDRCVGSVG